MHAHLTRGCAHLEILKVSAHTKLLKAIVSWDEFGMGGNFLFLLVLFVVFVTNTYYLYKLETDK